MKKCCECEETSKLLKTDSYENKFCSRDCAEIYHAKYHFILEYSLTEEEIIQFFGSDLSEYLLELDKLFPEDKNKTSEEFTEKYIKLIRGECKKR